MKKSLAMACIAIVSASCSSTDVGPYAPTAEEKATERVATQKAMCAIDNRARCDHMIENRLLFGRFFAPPTLGGMEEPEKLRGRKITTKFVSEAVAGIQQCNRVTAPSIPIVKGMVLDGGTYTLMGTSPLLEGSSTCFITPQTEGT